MFEWAATMLSQGTPTGAIDVVAVRDSFGNLSCSPFHVKLNKLAKKGDSCRTVKLAVNTRDVALSMKLGSAGEAFFVERTDRRIFNNNSTVTPLNATVLNQENVGSALQGMPLSRNNSISAVTVTGINSSAAPNEIRRRYRSFSDGDIDGDYKYLLDEQLVMAQSLCVPVSFHHCVGNDPPIPAVLDGTAEANTKLSNANNLKVLDNLRKHPSKSSTASLSESCASVSFDTGSVIDAGSHPVDASSMKSRHLPAVQSSCQDDNNLLNTSIRVRGMSSNVDTEHSTSSLRNNAQSELGIQRHIIDSASVAEDRSRISCDSLLPIGGSPSLPSATEIAPTPFPLLTGDGMKLSGRGEDTSPDQDIAADIEASPVTQLPVSSERGTSQRDRASSTALRNTGTPPSWSWTWGALPVKSKTKSSIDLVLLLENGNANANSPSTVGSPNSMKVSTAQSSKSSTANVTPNDSVADSMYGMSSQPPASESRPHDPIPGSNSSSSGSSSGIDCVDRLDLVLAMTKIPVEDEEESRKDFIDIDRSEGHTQLNDYRGAANPHCSVMTPIPLPTGILDHIEDQDHQSQVKIAKSDVGEVYGEFMASSSQNNSRPRGSGSQWRDSFADLGSSSFSLYRAKDFNQNQSHTRISHADASQPDLLGAYVKGDPSHGDMWQWDATAPQVKQEISATATRATVEFPSAASDDRAMPSMPIMQTGTQGLHETCSDQILEKSVVRDVTKGDGCSVVEGDCDGDTDQEADTLSLHDIPLDQISPEPAGGDFYDSDTESYLSLSLDDGEAVKENPLRAKSRKYRYRRVLVPSQEQLQSLDLCDGENEVSFELMGQESKGAYSTPLLRNQLFVWPHDAKIVIIDIEGAITAVNKGGTGWGMGGFLSAPRTAVHNGVAKLLTNIHGNGYHILYIAQSTSTALGTKEHLAKVAAGSDIKLPPGPVFQSPDSLIRAYGAARTDLFKAAALRGLKSLFPVGHNPYYACFGTRQCDMVAFSRCGVPGGRTFIVSPDTGEIRGINRTFRSSYEQVNQVLHEMFPAVSDSQTQSPRPRQHSGPGCLSPSSSMLQDSFHSVPDLATGANPVSVLLSPTNMRSNPPLPLASSLSLPVPPPLSLSSKSVRDATCSLAEEDFSDFNFWKIPHVSLA